MEANRYFIKQLDVAHLRAPFLKTNATSVSSELKYENFFSHHKNYNFFFF